MVNYFCTAEEIRTMAMFLMTKERATGCSRFDVHPWELARLKEEHHVRMPYTTLDLLWREGYIAMREKEEGGFTVRTLGSGELRDIAAMEV